MPLVLAFAVHQSNPCPAAVDTEKKQALSQTQFARLWRKAAHNNPFTPAFILNFGVIGAGIADAGVPCFCAAAPAMLVPAA
jgi:hypothetical protein